ncbi:hypothetical protein HHK36_010325 [Tetracentron sinense]|uniref:beta-galactosidase n=1 Tax=Tetracentron sinense TaxID=13715 RepID=A0A834ZDR6_TETSI|nr:hypothetical protein HHK36_010325 [Tetracentron sinense]
MAAGQTSNSFTPSLPEIERKKSGRNIEMWPQILTKAKHGGLNVIQTYVFWNIHEPVQGRFNCDGNYDLVKFIKLIHDMAHVWSFSSQSNLWLVHIENEYNTVELAYKESGTRYVQWAGTMVAGLKTGVPWVMCKQKDAPDPVVSAYTPSASIS